MRHISLNPVDIEQALLATTERQTPPSLLAFLPEAEKIHLPLLQAACREHGIRLVGAIFPELIVARKFVRQGAWLLPLPPGTKQLLVPGIVGDELAGARKIADAVRPALARDADASAKPTLFMFFDAMIPNMGSLLQALYLELSDEVEYAGVCAGSETFQPMPCLFDETQLFADGMVGVLLPGGLETRMAHGFIQPERLMSATSTQGNRIAMIDWRPAFDVYQEVISAEYGIALTRENFYQYAVHFPFGIQRASGEIVVRIPVALLEDGSLLCVGEVPENALLALLKAPAAGANGCLDVLSRDLAFNPDPGAGRNLLSFYCAGRRLHLGGDAESELQHLQDDLGTTNCAGALSLGEIGSTRRGGYPMFHNATLICRPW